MTEKIEIDGQLVWPNPDYRLSGEPAPYVRQGLRPEDTPGSSWRNPKKVTPAELHERLAARYGNSVADGVLRNMGVGMAVIQ